MRGHWRSVRKVLCEGFATFHMLGVAPGAPDREGIGLDARAGRNRRFSISIDPGTGVAANGTSRP